MSDDPEPADPLVRLWSALAFLRDEAERLDLAQVSCAISRVMIILRAQQAPEDGAPTRQ